MKSIAQPTGSPQLASDIIRTVTSQKDGKRESVLKEVEQTLGIVPGFVQSLPRETLEAEWRVMKDLEMSDKTAIPPKYKELIGLSVAAAIHCRYCSMFHSEGAQVHGANAAELNEALTIAKNTAGWSSYLNGLRYDIPTFDQEVRQIRTFVETQRTAQRV